MESCILINNDRFYAHHGVSEQERSAGNYFTVSLRLHVDIRPAATTDDLTLAVNYASVHETLKNEMAIPSRLLEHVAWRIVRALFDRFPTVEAIDLRLTKRNPPMGADIDSAGVELSCRREEMSPIANSE